MRFAGGSASCGVSGQQGGEQSGLRWEPAVVAIGGSTEQQQAMVGWPFITRAAATRRRAQRQRQGIQPAFLLPGRKKKRPAAD